MPIEPADAFHLDDPVLETLWNRLAVTLPPSDRAWFWSLLTQAKFEAVELAFAAQKLDGSRGLSPAHLHVALEILTLLARPTRIRYRAGTRDEWPVSVGALLEESGCTWTPERTSQVESQFKSYIQPEALDADPEEPL